MPALAGSVYQAGLVIVLWAGSSVVNEVIRGDRLAGELQPPPRVLGDARDASCAFRLPVAVDGTVPGFRVRRGHFGPEVVPHVDLPSIRVGQIGRGRAVNFAVRSLTKHALIAGSTGSGKTTTAMEILRQLWRDHDIPFLVIEPVNSDADDYRRLAAEPGFDGLEVCTVGDEGLRPLRFNPFEVPERVLVGEHMANLLACFKAAFGLWEPLPSIYQDALNLTYLRSGFLASERCGPGGAPGGGRRWWSSCARCGKSPLTWATSARSGPTSRRHPSGAPSSSSGESPHPCSSPTARTTSPACSTIR